MGELELAAPNGLGACVAVNGDDTVPVDVKLNVGLGAAAEDVDIPMLSLVAGFVAFNPPKRLAPLAGISFLEMSKLLDDAPVVAVPPNNALDCVVAGVGAESEGF